MQKLQPEEVCDTPHRHAAEDVGVVDVKGGKAHPLAVGPGDQPQCDSFVGRDQDIPRDDGEDVRSQARWQPGQHSVHVLHGGAVAGAFRTCAWPQLGRPQSRGGVGRVCGFNIETDQSRTNTSVLFVVAAVIVSTRGKCTWPTNRLDRGFVG
ncbi:hypothetical protein CI238_06452 [Colletotrichum incanum]|uniref:Uncharacterized protein n=1 Tax=Colletotrichum incanum TaxID=1573173 RepID=A0A161XXI7_COLIC|nr:hypothetical protein CI238_06452 [Colletotrichum incanum]